MGHEQQLVAAALKNRKASDEILAGVDVSKLTPPAHMLLKLAEEYYSRDDEAVSVSEAWLEEKLAAMVPNEKRLASYTLYLQEVKGQEVSAPNIIALVRESKKQLIADELGAALLGKESANKIKDLLSSYSEIEEREEDEDEAEHYHNMSVDDVVNLTVNPDNLIKIAPKSLNDVLDGGVLPQTNIIIYKRPEAGGSALALSIVRGFMLQGLSGIYFENEDPTVATVQRLQSCLTGFTKQELAEHKKEAQEMLDKVGFGLARVIPLTPGTPWEIERYVKRYKPQWIVINQIRHLSMKADTKVNQLEDAANFGRKMAKKYNLVSIGVTQAGDSAEQKLVLGMSDIDNSKTGIPGAVDIMLGLGTNAAYEAQGMRMISLPKNKASGKHVHFPVKIRPEISRIEDV